mmetsp:Transcript_46387/g.110485  ORF Transcript_46387/g.110485 Transcript_46387/m.110485 type:complete len:355 (+) Transcript_46387:61-1125(+)
MAYASARGSRASSMAGDMSPADGGAGWGGYAQPLLSPAEVCSCGTVFVHDAQFCRRCGKSRPRVPSSPSIASSAIMAAAALPRPPLSHRILEEEDDVQMFRKIRPWWHVPPRVKLGLIAAAVLLLWLRFFYHFTPPLPPAPPWTLERQCAVPVPNYHIDPLVQSQCGLLGSWQAQAQAHAGGDLGGGCKIDHNTKQIVCERKAACQGGHIDERRWMETTHNATYDCGARCAGTLLVDCCNLCLHLNAKDLGFDGIQCRGCEEGPLRHIVEQNSAECSRDENGYFFCETQSSCEVGEPTTVVLPRWYDCQVTPCDQCSNSQLHAECCAVCLQDMCTHPERRTACQGCQADFLDNH